MRARQVLVVGALCSIFLAGGVATAALLGISLIGTFPQINYVSNEASATNYSASGQTLTVLASPVALRLAPASPPRLVQPTGFPPAEVVSMSIQVANTGGLIGGVPGDDLIIQGEVDADGNGSVDYAGILLTGEIQAFGFQDTGSTSDEFDFRFSVTGGLLAPVFFVGRDAGVTLTSEESNFVGNFGVNFNGKAKGLVAPIPRQNRPPVCAANGPYEAECAGGTTTIILDGSQSSDPDSDQLTYSWSSNCPGAVFSGGDTATPTITIDTSSGCNVNCEVTLSVSDGISPPATCMATIHVSDNNSPQITCPANVQQECNLPSDPSHTGTATASDDCDPHPTVTYTDSEVSGTCPVTRVITRTWTATDSCQHTATCVQTITLVDTKPPVITSCPANKTVTCAQGFNPSVTGSPTANDACDPNPAATYSDETITAQCNCPVTAVIKRTWTVTDACGNAATCSQTITVRDTNGPQVVCPPNATVQCGNSTKPQYTGKATATDSCDPNPSITYSDTSCGSCPKVISRKWKATDACGNSSYCTQTITVVDTTPPTIDCPPDKTINCGDSTNPCKTGTAKGTDACDSCVDVTYTDTRVGNCPGTITRLWKAKDNCGNIATCTQTITILTSPPCPEDICFWKDNCSRWPVQALQIGNATYNQTQLTRLLSGKLPDGRMAGDDAAAKLAKQLIAAKFNLLIGAEPREIEDDVEDGDDLLRQSPPGSNPTGTRRRNMNDVSNKLDCFNDSNPCGCRRYRD